MQQQTKSKGRRRERGSVLALIKMLASRPDGVSRAELGERMVLESNAPILSAACKRGHIVSAKRPGQRMRYFITAQNAAEWMAREPELKPAKVKPPKAEKTAATARPAAVKAKMGAKVPHRPTPTDHQKPPTYTAGPSKIAPRTIGEPIITDKTIRTIDDKQRPTARWQMRQEAPDERWPSFAASRPGVDPITGRAWGSQA